MKKQLLVLCLVFVVTAFAVMKLISGYTENNNIEGSSAEAYVNCPTVTQVMNPGSKFAGNTTSYQFLNLNGKIYLCSTSYSWTKDSNGYKAGMITKTNAYTRRDMRLEVIIDTEEGMKPVQGTGSVEGAGIIAKENLVTTGKMLKGLEYVYFSGSCEYTHTDQEEPEKEPGPSVTGIINYSAY